MEYRNFGRTGMKVSQLCMGCMYFGAKTPEEEAYKLFDACIDAGINFFDTANVYNRGTSESVLGKILADRGNREKLVIATKVHGRMDDDDPNAAGNSRRHIIEQCEASLKRLGTDYVDLYQIHRPDSHVPIDETLRALDDLVRAGKVRYIGTSTYAAWQSVEALWASKELGLNRFVSEQPPYSIADRRIERELLPMARTYGYGIIPWSPLAGGLLTGKYGRGKEAPEGARYADSSRPNVAKRVTERLYDALEELDELVVGKGVTMSQFALAWVMNQPGVTSPIIGSRNLEQLRDNLEALEVEIADADRERVDEIVPPGTNVSGFYEADWGPHPHRVV
jgi:aryl-alcohol dehydrogenase-like predicted oxidoreductase